MQRLCPMNMQICFHDCTVLVNSDLFSSGLSSEQTLSRQYFKKQDFEKSILGGNPTFAFFLKDIFALLPLLDFAFIG